MHLLLHVKLLLRGWHMHLHVLTGRIFSRTAVFLRWWPSLVVNWVLKFGCSFFLSLVVFLFRPFLRLSVIVFRWPVLTILPWPILTLLFWPILTLLSWPILTLLSRLLRLRIVHRILKTLFTRRFLIFTMLIEIIYLLLLHPYFLLPWGRTLHLWRILLTIFLLVLDLEKFFFQQKIFSFEIVLVWGPSHDYGVGYVHLFWALLD